MPEIVQFAMSVHAKGVYCFVLDGDRGTGGCPLLLGLDGLDRDEYRRRSEELIAMLRRSADLYEADLVRQGYAVAALPEKPTTP